MSAAKKTAGPSSARVAANVRRLRTEQQLSTYELARLLGEAGWPIGAGGITRIEGGDRRVDVDDLVALAIVLGVSPNVLLLPPSRPPLLYLQAELEMAPNSFTGLGDAWAWATGEMVYRRGGEVTLHDEAQFALDNRPHRFVLWDGHEPLVTKEYRQIHAAVERAFGHGSTPWQLRTLFERALIAAMEGYPSARAPEIHEPELERGPPPGSPAYNEQDVADGQG
jgi:transcriptional regulator with XRE-family HTH domain